MAFTEDGSLLLVEGDFPGGNGKLLRLRFSGSERPSATIEAIAQGLDTPVNLAIAGDGAAWLTESRLRHRFPTAGPPSPAPETFWLTRVQLG